MGEWMNLGRWLEPVDGVGEPNEEGAREGVLSVWAIAQRDLGETDTQVFSASRRGAV